MPTPTELAWLETAMDAAVAAGHFHPGCAAAEAAAETGWGQHMPQGSNNVLGIKATHSWTGPVVGGIGSEQNKDGSWSGPQDDLWCVFPDMQACFARQIYILQNATDGHGNLLYIAALNAETDEDYIAAECHVWSTSLAKAQLVLEIFQQHATILNPPIEIASSQ